MTTTSGVFTFDPSFAGLLDEACDRAGIDPRSIGQDHIISAEMSLNLMLTQWAVIDGDALYRNSSTTQALSAASYTWTLPSGAWDIISNDMMLAYNGATTEIPLARISREDYLELPNKSQTGRPTQFYVDRSVRNAPAVFVWPIPDAACVFRYDYMRYIETLTSMSQNIDVEVLWLDAVAYGLALRLAEKFNLERVPLLTGRAKETYMFARRAGSGQSQIVFVGRGFGAPGRTRRR